MENNQKKIQLDVREDGVYLIVRHPSFGNRVGRKDILDLLEASGVKDIDFAQMTEVFKSNEPVITKKISSNPHIVRRDEGLKVEVSKDRMRAAIIFTPPLNSDKLLSLEDVKEWLRKQNVVHGVDDDSIRDSIENKKYGATYVVARGTPPTDGIDGYLEYHFNKDKKKSLKPKELASGRVDYHALDLIEKGYQGQVLVTSVPPIEGLNGMDVHGRSVSGKRAKPTPPLPKGRNVGVGPDGTSLVADLNGQIVMDNGKVTVQPILEVRGDVDLSTGDIDFNGTVVVRGNVLTGFAVQAIEDIEIIGSVEGALIKADGNVILCSGVQGQEKAQIIAGGDITAKFIENAYVSAAGNIISESIMHSTIKCEGRIELEGRKGLLVGGKVSVRHSVKARLIGSGWATATDIAVGINQDKLEEYNQALNDMEKLKDDFKHVENVVNLLTEANKKNQLAENKKNLLVKSIHTKLYLRQKILELQKKVDEMLPQLDNKNGFIAAIDRIRPGVKVVIGNAMLYVRDDIPSCKLVNMEGTVTIQSYV